MIDLSKAKEEFLAYASNYDTQNININRKIKHTLRVVDVSKKIAKSLNLENDKVDIAELIGLLHDIARFEQYTRYGTYNDMISINHGELGVEILKNEQYIRKYIEDDKYDEIIKKAIRNHNAYSLEDGLTDEEIVFCNIIRDSDKIDILYQISEIFKHWEDQYSNEEKITPEVLEQFNNGQLINHRFKKTKLDAAIGVISYIYDFNFKESFKIIKEKDYMNSIIDDFNIKDFQVRKQLAEIKKVTNEYIEQKTK